MRKDMHKVVTESPRANGRYAYRHCGRRTSKTELMATAQSELAALDDSLDDDGDLAHHPTRNRRHQAGENRSLMPNKEGMRRPYSSYLEERKVFTDHISPLRRYLHSKIGSKWDLVLSEIRQTIPNDGMNAQHILQHVGWEVATKVHRNPDGTLEDRSSRLSPSNVSGLYVDPDTGLLQMVPRATWPDWRKTSQVIIDASWKKLGPEKEALKVKGIWYWIEFGTAPTPTVLRYVHADGTVEEEIVRNDRYDFLARLQADHELPGVHSTGLHNIPVKPGTRYRARLGHQLDCRALRLLGVANARDANDHQGYIATPPGRWPYRRARAI